MRPALQSVLPPLCRACLRRFFSFQWQPRPRPRLPFLPSRRRVHSGLDYLVSAIPLTNTKPKIHRTRIQTDYRDALQNRWGPILPASLDTVCHLREVLEANDLSEAFRITQQLLARTRIMKLPAVRSVENNDQNYGAGGTAGGEVGGGGILRGDGRAARSEEMRGEGVGGEIDLEALEVAAMLDRELLRLVTEIMADRGRTPGLPCPYALAYWLDMAGVLVGNTRSCYLSLGMRSTEQQPEQFLAAFEVALRAEVQRCLSQSVEEEERGGGEEATEEEAAQQEITQEEITQEKITQDATPEKKQGGEFNFADPALKDLFVGNPGTALFVAFLNLLRQKQTSPLVTSLLNDLASFRIPNEKPLRAFFSQHAIPKGRELLSLAKRLNMRLTLVTPARLRVHLTNLGKHPDPENIMKFYRAARAEMSPLPASAYGAFITCLLWHPRGQPVAVQVWNDMVNDGHQPTIKHWTALLAAYGRASADRSALTKIWRMMLAQGVQPDVQAWTALVYSQLLARQVKEAMESLQSMLAAGIAPVTATINAAVNGLLKHRAYDHANGVLALGQAAGVSADLVTYNTMLKSLLRDGKEALVPPLLQRMREAGLGPNGVTVTIIMDDAMRRSQGPQDVRPLIDTLRKLDVAGLKPSVQTFTALIEGLLWRDYFQVATEVMEYMARSGVPPNVFTYTVLLRDAFRRGDTPRVLALWEMLEARKILKDNTVFSETIYGFATMGDAQRMWQWRDLMEQGGYGWPKLKTEVAVARSLIVFSKHEDARMVLQDVVRRDLVGRSDLNGRTEQEFWDVVEEIGGEWALEMRKSVIPLPAAIF